MSCPIRAFVAYELSWRRSTQNKMEDKLLGDTQLEAGESKNEEYGSFKAPTAVDARDRKHFHIIGGGPVGFATAVLLAKEGFQCSLYEGRSEIPNNVEESYPIGINPRSLHTMQLIDPDLAQRAMDTGVWIDTNI